MTLDYSNVVVILGTICCVAGILFCVRIARTHFGSFEDQRPVSLEGVHEVSGCASCHVMRPMVTDMKNPNSGTLAARHYKNKWIATDQCYHCP